MAKPDQVPTAPPPTLSADALAGQSGVRHGFFTRQGGVSGGVYASLNCGFGSSDRKENVAENRSRAAAVLGAGKASLVTAYQVHGTDVAEVTAPWARGRAPRADAMVSRTPGVVLGVLTADCAPVLFGDGQAGIIATAHAGWRGALAGVIEATVAAMEALGAERSRIAAAVGPSIGPDSYEVGPEFPAPFIDRRAEDGKYFSPARRDGHFMFDLGGYVLNELERSRVGTAELIARDNCAEETLLFSYRRATLGGEPDFGRGLSAIVLGG